MTNKTLREVWHEDCEALGVSPDEEQRLYDLHWPDGDPELPVLPSDPNRDNTVHREPVH